MPSSPPEFSFAADLWEAAKVLLPPFLAAGLGGYAVSRWRSREDAIEKRLDEICAAILEVIKALEGYWSTAHGPQTFIETAAIDAGIFRIDGLRTAISAFLSDASVTEITLSAAEFFRNATGGNYGVVGRPTDLPRAAQIHRVGSAYILALRSGRMRDLKGWRRRR